VLPLVLPSRVQSILRSEIAPGPSLAWSTLQLTLPSRAVPWGTPEAPGRGALMKSARAGRRLTALRPLPDNPPADGLVRKRPRL